MDDYSISSLTESKNELCARLVNILTPLVLDGFKSIFNEAVNVCQENDEDNKYLLTFQNFISRIPKWNNEIVEKEKNRIIEESGCGYLEDLVTCTHVIHLKALTCVRVGQSQKKVDIDIPDLNKFIHNVYITVARKIYTNVYLYEMHILPLQIQKHNRELELIVKEGILTTIRDSIPIENILRTYIDESEEQDVEVEEKEEVIPIEVEKEEPIEEHVEENVQEKNVSDVHGSNTMINESQNESNLGNIELKVNDPVGSNVSFNNLDETIDDLGKIENVSAPKNIPRLEEISRINSERRRLEEEEYDDDDEYDEKLNIGPSISLGELNIEKLGGDRSTRPVLTDIEVLH